MDAFLMRHAESDHGPSWESDAARPLSQQGIEQHGLVARKLASERLVTVDIAWVSPMLRARQTLDITLERLAMQVPINIIDELEPWGDPEVVAEKLRGASRDPATSSKSILVVGHNPNMSDLLQALCGPRVPGFGTSDVAKVAIDTEGHARLLSFMKKWDLIKGNTRG